MSQLNPHVGIIGTGIYLPKGRMTAAEIAKQTNGQWTEEAVVKKLGIIEKIIPTQDEGTQYMGAQAAHDALQRTGIHPAEIDLILCIGEEWKEYPLTTSGIFIQEEIKATNAWGIDLQQRCCSTVAAMKIAKDMILADDEIKTVMVVGGYRNGDFIDYTDKKASMMFNLSAGAGAIILQKNLGKNVLLGCHIMTDGTMARDAGVAYGGIAQPINKSNIDQAYKSLTLLNEEHMKTRLNEVSLNNWFHCIDRAFAKSNLQVSDLGYVALLHFKPSMFVFMIEKLGLSLDQSIYLDKYGHMGQIDQILSLQFALEQNKVKDGTVVSMVAAGIGYAWAANVIKWGPIESIKNDNNKGVLE